MILIFRGLFMSEAELRQFLADKKLKLPSQRTHILEIFLRQGGRVSSEELFYLFRSENQAIGQATVYRTLKPLTAARAAGEVSFAGGAARYERRDNGDHLDHIVCEKCNRQYGFHDLRNEALQMEQAKKPGYVLTYRRMVLFGICSDCSICIFGGSYSIPH
jgi:Fur family ferric uptake transcriptional regulator